MKKIIDFDQIQGLKGIVRPDGQELIISGSPEVIQKLKKYLTVENTSVKYRISQIKRSLAKGVRWASKLEAELVELRAKEVVEYFAELPDGTLSCPPGFWWICQEAEGHLGTIPYVELPEYDGKTPRPFQVEACKELLKYKKAMISLSTGAGKTILTAQLVHSALTAGKRVMVIVPTIELVNQTSKVLQGYFGAKNVAPIGGLAKWRAGAWVYVTTINSSGHAIDGMDVVVVDECVPGCTRIMTDEGKVPISLLHQRKLEGIPLPKVLSFNEVSNQFEYKSIDNVFKNSDKNEILEIKIGGRAKIKCSKKHKILTSNGWKSAEDVTTDDFIYVNNDPKVTRGNVGNKPLTYLQKQLAIGSFLGDGHLSKHRGRYRVQFTHGMEQEEYCKWKLRKIDGTFHYNEHNGYSGKPAIAGSTRLFNFDFEFPSSKSDMKQEIIDMIDWPAVAIWFMDDGHALQQGEKNFGALFHTESFSKQTNESLVKKLNSMGVEARSRFIPYSDRRYPGYWVIALPRSGLDFMLSNIKNFIHPDLAYKCGDIGVTMDGWEDREEISYDLSPVRSIVERKYDKTKTTTYYGMFDLEVKDNHNYLIASKSSDTGIVVHNCHHSSSESYTQSLMLATRSEHVYGLTATPCRADGLALGVHACCGPVVLEKTTRWCIDSGYLSPVSVNMVSITGIGLYTQDMLSVKAYGKLCSHPKTLSTLAKMVINAKNKGLKTLILFKTEGAGSILAKHLEQYGIVTQAAHSKFRKPLNDFRNTEIDLLISNAPLCGEGVDIPTIDCLIDMTQSASESTTRQILGRGLRLSPGKKQLLFFSVVLKGYGSWGKDSEGDKIWRDQFTNFGNFRRTIYSEVCDSIRECEI